MGASVVYLVIHLAQEEACTFMCVLVLIKESEVGPHEIVIGRPQRGRKDYFVHIPSPALLLPGTTVMTWDIFLHEQSYYLYALQQGL